MSDLIERLRVLANDLDSYEFSEVMGAADMIEQLQAHGRGTDIAEIKLLHEQVAQLQTENQRYRAALEKIANESASLVPAFVAREALGENDEQAISK